jgi:hypothetical protein
MNSIKKTARIAGLLYLLIAVCGGFAFFAGYENLIVAGDATATAQKVMASEMVFRIGTIGDAFTFLLEIILTVLLYKIFKPVSQTLSLIAAYARLAMTTMIGMNLLNKFFVMMLLSGADYLKVFDPDQLDALVLLFLNAFEFGGLIWGVFFGLHLLVIGYLIFRSNFFPKVLGGLFLFAGLGYLIHSLGIFLLPQYEVIYTWVIMATIPAELAFAFWLLIKGVNVERWEKFRVVN